MKTKPHGNSDYAFDHEGKLGLIPTTLGVGLRWTHERDKHRYVTRLLEDYHFLNGKRKIQLRLSSFRGMPGAMHFYCTLRARSPEVYNLTKKTGGHGGYVGVSKDSPLYFEVGREFCLDVTRRLTKVEKDMNGELIGKIGDWTHRFNTEEEASRAAIAAFKRRFGPGWVLLGGEDDTILAET